MSISTSPERRLLDVLDVTRDLVREIGPSSIETVEVRRLPSTTDVLIRLADGDRHYGSIIARRLDLGGRVDYLSQSFSDYYGVWRGLPVVLRGALHPSAEEAAS